MKPRQHLPNTNFVLGLLATAMPIVFVWHLELIATFSGRLTNGFMVFNGLKVYHVLMYTVFTVSFAASYRLIKLEAEKQGYKDSKAQDSNTGSPPTYSMH